ncbi:MAG: hypothetical protein QM773_21340 [Hyphomonadaceae bacterium]
MSVGSMTIAGGNVVSPAGFSAVGAVSGSGTITAKLSTADGSSFTALGGTLTLGDAAAADAFSNYLSTTAIGANQVNLLSASLAKLGSSTTLTGGTLASLNGIDLPTARTLSGHGIVQGKFVNQGQVSGGGGAEVLAFAGPVSGAGSFSGNVRFDGNYSPGNSPAAISFENLSLGSTLKSILNLQELLQEIRSIKSWRPAA